MSYVFTPPPTVALPIRGSSELFPVRRVYCVGRNYAEHAIEMGHDPDKEPPFFFQKNPDNIVLDGKFPYPAMTKDVHYEIELIVAIGKGGENIPVEQALDHVYGYGVALDMTRRDLQGEAKKMGRPWEVGKAFEESAPSSEIVPAAAIGHPAEGAIWLKVNGELKQKGDLNQLIWKVPETIAYLSGLFRLAPGDIIMTGTPAGVGSTKKGDVLEGHVEGVGDLKVEVV
ncbi:fumarylacetoacetate hydrolase family protein [Faunimonas sp. B44]|uniref:fumarylacetoacetate hydrolase family protein n=1 Tax=Faunimonas sp. B44 TaxID=3461493 RepID=UPI004044D09D